MNPEFDQVFGEDETKAAPPEESPAPTPSPASVEPAKNRRPRGKIARLCKADRDQLNTMLRDGVPYAQVISRMGEVCKDVIPRNVSSWHNGPGYQRWAR